MPKYSINTIGDIVKYDTGQKIEVNEIISDLIRLPNKSNKVDSQTNKFSELNRGGGFVVTENLFSNADGSRNKNEINRVVNSTQKLNNSSFGFDQEQNANNEVTFYNSYNSIFDLNLDNFNTDNFESIQIFAENLDFYGFPLVLTNTGELIADELPVRLFSLLDMIIAATVPIVTISTLQFLLQENENNGSSLIPVLFGETKRSTLNEDEALYSLGSYIKYEKSGEFNLFYHIAKVTLNSFERLMNYPRFTLPPKSEGVFDLILSYINFLTGHILYFVNGYVFYLNPGLKTNFTLDLNLINLTSLTDFIASLITTNSSRHQYNLLIRKILRNNYFLNKVINSEARNTANNTSNFNNQLIFLSSFFFRFIGERIAVGENLIRTDTSKVLNNSSFLNSRIKDKLSLSIGNIIQDSSILGIDNYKKQAEENKKKKKESYRIPYEDVKKIEEIIDLDYMPFSLQDLRTNDVLKFHAFIESISDSYSANYNEMGGYGRLEKIKTYANTTRSVNVTFKIVAMSYEDHGEMWYMINKIVSMLYPQWSKGVPMRESTMEKIKNEVDANFNLDEELKKLSKISIPFSQLPSNSPMVRLRVGDLITSNYSKYTAAKLFGFEPKKWSNKVSLNEISISKEEFLKMYEDSLNEAIDAVKILDYDIDSGNFFKSIRSIEGQKFTIEFEENNKAQAPNNIVIARGEAQNPRSYKFEIVLSDLSDSEKQIDQNNFKNPAIEITSLQSPLTLQANVTITPLDKFYTLLIRFKSAKNVNLFLNENHAADETAKLYYNKRRAEKSKVYMQSIFNKAQGIFYKKFIEYTKRKDQARQNTQQKQAQEVASESGKKDLQQNFLDATSKDNKINNPVIKAFESNMGKGLAGFITSFNIDWEQGSFWEIKEGNRAPKIVTISLGLSPSHDIPLGLDHRGNLRSLAYSVGSSASINRGLYMQEQSFNYDENQFKKREE